MIYIYYNNINDTNDIDYFIFTFEFDNIEINNIISSFNDKINDYYPQIYSSQMFYIIDFNKTFLYKLENNYILIYQYIYGTNNKSGWIDVPYQNNNSKISTYINRNFRGRLFSNNIDSDINTIIFSINDGNEFLLAIKLEYNMINKGIIEIKSGEIRSQIMRSGHFPLYYYLKIKNEDYINININLRLNSYDDSILKNDFDIKGYILNEETIKRKIIGESIQLQNPINGTYSNKFKIGLLEINRKKVYDNNNYLLIEIINNDKVDINTYILVEFVSKENSQDIYFMPIDQYLIETFDNYNETIREENKYHILINQRGNNQVLIEISPEYNDIELIFTNETYPNGFKCSDFNCSFNLDAGFKQYTIYNVDNDNIYFSVMNTKRRKANYMIRYFYCNKDIEYIYKLNDKMEQKYIDTNNGNITLSLTFDQIQIIYKDKPLNNTSGIIFFINGLLYKKNKDSEELLNTTSLLQERMPLYEKKIIREYNSEKNEMFELTF